MVLKELSVPQAIIFSFYLKLSGVFVFMCFVCSQFFRMCFPTQKYQVDHVKGQATQSDRGWADHGPPNYHHQKYPHQK